MKRLLACVIMLILAKACGVEEPYDTDFIGITQAAPDRLTGNKHRCYISNGTRVCGAHANAYLINKVHKKDNESTSIFTDQYLNLTVDIEVGWYGQNTDTCGGCTGKKNRIAAGVAPTSAELAGTPTSGEGTCTCAYKTCDQREPEHRTNYTKVEQLNM